MPRISVVMPVYNAEKYLREAMDSILAQTYTDFEFIIIDDGSTDSSPEIVRSYDDARIRFFQNEHNMGVAATLNRGLDLAEGEYIARMDSDDISLPERFAKQVEYMDKHPECAVCGTSFVTFGEGVSCRESFCESDPKKAKSELIFYPCVAHPTAMIRKYILDENHIKYDPEYEGTEDYVLWWKLSEYGTILSLPEILFKYRAHLNQISRSTDIVRQNRYIRFVGERMKRFNIVLQADDMSIFFRYTHGEAKIFCESELKRFTHICRQVIQQNKKKTIMEQRTLEKIIQSALYECLLSERITTKQRIKQAFCMAINGNISIKQFCFTFVRCIR